ncbi:helix-turn-helix domain-containing protein [Wenjunlia tyrosinilytica]|uniref:helix-turn-helix domain-containing protein n=1 Tax=Wenjunlia tyrosinilytica TaxID=1544741 RepID=UPI003570A6F8
MSLTAPVHRGGRAVREGGRGRPDHPGAPAGAPPELDQPLTLARPAREAAMPGRAFARGFTDATGSNPLPRLIEQRVLAAQGPVEDGDLTVEEIVRRCGFGSAVSPRRHFARHVGVSPREHRRAFRGRHGLRRRRGSSGARPPGGSAQREAGRGRPRAPADRPGRRPGPLA